MNERGPTLRLACVVPVFAYALVVILLHPLRWSLLSAAAGAALTLPLVAVVTSRFAGWIYAPAALIVGTTAVAWVVHPGAVASPFADLAMGLLIAAPVGIFAAMAERRDSLPTVLLGLFGGLGVLELDLATVRALSSASPAGATAWASAAATVVGDQLGSLFQWAAGAGVAPPPLGYAGDPWFDALVVIAASGILLAWLTFEARLGARSVQGPNARPPPAGPAWTGVGSLVIAVGAILAFELAAAVSPAVALTGAAAAVAGTSVGIAWLVQPSSRPRGLRHGRAAGVEPVVGTDTAD